MAAPFPSPTKTWHDNTYPSLSPTRPELSAKGKAVLITGGGTGIGAETARYFAQAGAARIAILGRREQPLLDTKASIEQKFPGVEVFVATTDVTKESEVDAAFSKFAGNGKIDVVISNAGVSGPKEPVDIVDTEKFMQGVEQNIKGALYVGRAFLRHASADAVAVNVSSHAAHMHFGPVFASYSVAKMAAVRLWDSVAAVNPNLSIFHIQPGIVDTAMNREAGGVAAVGFEDHGKWNVFLLRRIT
jgi:NAD(P)-dependent dehydrogenase (short-subunit alcohol dehydrogenase family)